MNRTKPPIIHLIFFFLFLDAAIISFYFAQAQIYRVSQIRSEISYLTDSRSRLDDLAAQFPKFSGIQQNLLSTLPKNEKEVASYAASLEKIAKDNNLTLLLALDDFQSPIDVSGKYISGVGIEITLEGSYSGISKFLFEVSKLKYYTKIDKISIVKLDGKAGVKAIINGSLMVNLAI